MSFNKSLFIYLLNVYNKEKLSSSKTLENNFHLIDGETLFLGKTHYLKKWFRNKKKKK